MDKSTKRTFITDKKDIKDTIYAKDTLDKSTKDTVYNWYKEYKGYIYAKDTIDII